MKRKANVVQRDIEWVGSDRSSEADRVAGGNERRGQLLVDLPCVVSMSRLLFWQMNDSVISSYSWPINKSCVCVCMLYV